jgi:predicted aldo/keto reductase-like oxidoreductase
MKYRKFGKLDIQPSALGFGCMRLPLLKDGSGNIDEAEAIRLIRDSIDKGVDYVDTAYGYHGGKSELVVAKALKDGYRARVFLATKCPPWHVKTSADFDRLLNEQLAKLETDHIDMYMLHAVNVDSWKTLKELDCFSFLDRAKKDGRIRYAGFSFHDN